MSHPGSKAQYKGMPEVMRYRILVFRWSFVPQHTAAGKLVTCPDASTRTDQYAPITLLMQAVACVVVAYNIHVNARADM